HVSHGSLASPLRAQGLGRAENHRALLDHHPGAGADWLVDAENPMSNASLQLDNTRVLVVGCGATGVSAACFAARHGAMVRVIDSRATPPRAAELRRRCPQAELLVGGLPLSALASVDQLLVSPGIDLREPLLQTARQRGLPMCGDIEWFARRAQAPVVAITGSNGKSTVTAWLAEIAEAAGASVAVGGNFGTPALDLLAP